MVAYTGWILYWRDDWRSEIMFFWLFLISLGVNFALYAYCCYLRGFKKEVEREMKK